MSSWWCWLKCWFSIADCQITKGYPNKYLHNFDCEIPEISHSYAWWYIYSSWQPTHVAIVKGLKIQPWELGDIKGYYTHIDIIYIYIFNIFQIIYIYIFTYLNLSWKFAAKERFTLRRFGDDIWAEDGLERGSHSDCRSCTWHRQKSEPNTSTNPTTYQVWFEVVQSSNLKELPSGSLWLKMAIYSEVSH